MENKLIGIIADVLEMEPEDINDDVSPDNVEEWDSFQHIVLITNLEEGFGITLHPQEATGIRSVADIRVILRKRGVEV